MTLETLQNNIVLRLANFCHCRYWMNYYDDREKPATMAISLRFDDDTLVSQGLCDDLAKRGFRIEGDLFLIQRTNPDGSPYISRL